MTQPDLSQAFRVVAELWPVWKPSPGMLALWTQLLSDLGESEVKAAVLLHASESVFPPTVADLRRIAFAERGATDADRALATRKLLGLASGERLSREDALDTSRSEPWRDDLRRRLAERYQSSDRPRLNGSEPEHIGDLTI